MPRDRRQIRLNLEDFLDTICHGCAAASAGMEVVNPKMYCERRRKGEYCRAAANIGMLICSRTSLENKTIFEEGH